MTLKRGPRTLKNNVIMSQAQMLFDIAQAGLQFAGTTEGGSIAERSRPNAAALRNFHSGSGNVLRKCLQLNRLRPQKSVS